MMTQEDVDEWVKENGENDACSLLDDRLPGMRRKLCNLDKRIRDVLKEIQKEFPDAQYYTASGGFNLVLGSTHRSVTGLRETPQRQRVCWSGQATIGDGDW